MERQMTRAAMHIQDKKEGASVAASYGIATVEENGAPQVPETTDESEAVRNEDAAAWGNV